MPSVSQAATPMKPRANPGNRTRQPKGCASRIAKPARLGCASQNHLMMIILNKTVAATVAQHDLEPLAVHAQSETTACKRHVLCANFSKTRALFLLLSHRPQRKGRGGGLPQGVRRNSVCVRARARVRAYVYVWLHGRHRVRCVWRLRRGRPGGVRRGLWLSRPWQWCLMFVVSPRLWRSGVVDCVALCVVATRRWMLVFAMVLAQSALTQFASQLNGAYSDSHQANDDEKGKIRQRIRRPGRQPGSPEESAAWMFDN